MQTMSSFDTAVGVFLICLWMCSIIVSLTNSLAVNSVSYCTIRLDIPLAVLTSIYNIHFVGTLLKWGAPQEAEAALVPDQLILNRPALISGLPLPSLQHIHRFLIPLGAISLIPLIFVYRNSCPEDLFLSKGVQAFYWGAYCCLFGLGPFGIYLWHRMYTQQTAEAKREQAAHYSAMAASKSLISTLIGTHQDKRATSFKECIPDFLKLLQQDENLGRTTLVIWLLLCFQQRYASTLSAITLAIPTVSPYPPELSCSECKYRITPGEQILHLPVSPSEKMSIHKYCFQTSHAQQKQPVWTRESVLMHIAENC